MSVVKMNESTCIKKSAFDALFNIKEKFGYSNDILSQILSIHVASINSIKDISINDANKVIEFNSLIN